MEVGAGKCGATEGDLARANAILNELKIEENGKYAELVACYQSLPQEKKDVLDGIFAGAVIDDMGPGAFAEDITFFESCTEEMEDSKKVELLHFLLNEGMRTNV